MAEKITLNKKYTRQGGDRELEININPKHLRDDGTDRKPGLGGVIGSSISDGLRTAGALLGSIPTIAGLGIMNRLGLIKSSAELIPQKNLEIMTAVQAICTATEASQKDSQLEAALDDPRLMLPIIETLDANYGSFPGIQGITDSEQSKAEKMYARLMVDNGYSTAADLVRNFDRLKGKMYENIHTENYINAGRAGLELYLDLQVYHLAKWLKGRLKQEKSLEILRIPYSTQLATFLTLPKQMFQYVSRPFSRTQAGDNSIRFMLRYNLERDEPSMVVQSIYGTNDLGSEIELEPNEVSRRMQLISDYPVLRRLTHWLHIVPPGHTLEAAEIVIQNRTRQADRKTIGLMAFVPNEYSGQLGIAGAVQQGLAVAMTAYTAMSQKVTFPTEQARQDIDKMHFVFPPNIEELRIFEEEGIKIATRYGMYMASLTDRPAAVEAALTNILTNLTKNPYYSTPEIAGNRRISSVIKPVRR